MDLLIGSSSTFMILQGCFGRCTQYHGVPIVIFPSCTSMGVHERARAFEGIIFSGLTVNRKIAFFVPLKHL